MDTIVTIRLPNMPALNVWCWADGTAQVNVSDGPSWVPLGLVYDPACVTVEHQEREAPSLPVVVFHEDSAPCALGAFHEGHCA